MAHISNIKLIRTDTTLDLSQKAEKGILSTILELLFYTRNSCLLSFQTGNVVHSVESVF
ncbi:Serine/threonine-protein kinase ZRK7 [Linum perenne]